MISSCISQVASQVRTPLNQLRGFATFAEQAVTT
jgi:hypothetical protein